MGELSMLSNCLSCNSKSWKLKEANIATKYSQNIESSPKVRVCWHVGRMTESFWNAFRTWSVAREKCNHECTPQEHSFENTFRKSPSSSTKTRISLPVQNWKPWNSRLQDSLDIRWKIIPFWICKVHFFNEKSRHTWPTETTWCQLHGGHVATGRSNKGWICWWSWRVRYSRGG